MFHEAIIVLLVSQYSEGWHRTFDPLWTCSNTPVACVPVASGVIHECQGDADCEIGARCCYAGCTRRCQLPNPCEKVICKSGYACLHRETPCSQPPCQTEASCVPESQVNCPQLMCTPAACPAGYIRTNDTNGCQTCQCELKKVCGPTCILFCNYGKVLDANGCPTCKCIPEPENPCTKVNCANNQECRLIKAECLKAPCKPLATCVPKTKVSYDNTCNLRDKTTGGYPVLYPDNITELDCAQRPCNDGTVCTQLGANVHRCCWQNTQDKVLGPPKVGECPQEYMLDGTEMSQTCEIDGQCPGDQKCCYRTMMPGMTRFYGSCFNPIHKIVENKAVYCRTNSILYDVFSTVGIC